MTYTITRQDAAEDLRVLRAAIRISSGFASKDAAPMQRLQELADSIEEQVRPAIEEPQEWGSLIVAGTIDFPERVRWQRDADGFWQAEKPGFAGRWGVLKDPEVLRIGVGPEPLAEWESELLNQQARRDAATAVLSAMDVDQYLIDAVANARPR